MTAPKSAAAQLAADFAELTRTGWIRPPAGRDAGWQNRMEGRALAGVLCTFDGHGGFQITDAGRAARKAAERNGR